MSDSMLRSALLVSAAVHGLFGLWVETRGLTRAPVFREIADSWTGPGIEIDAVPVAPNGDGANASTRAAPNEKAAARDVTESDPVVTRDKGAARAPRPVAATHTPPPTKRRASAASADGAASTSADAAPSGSGTPSGAFGAQGLPVGVRHLPKAFTRALSIADRSDPRWLALTPGPAGEARVEITVADDGKLGELAYRSPDERDRLAPVVRHLLENTRLLLESGHFSVDPTTLRAGVQRLRVRVEVVERAGASDPEGDPNELKELEYEAPTATKPGRGSFALNSGRRVIGWVYVE